MPAPQRPTISQFQRLWCRGNRDLSSVRELVAFLRLELPFAYVRAEGTSQVLDLERSAVLHDAGVLLRHGLV